MDLTPSKQQGSLAEWIRIAPSVIADPVARRALRRCARRLAGLDTDSNVSLMVERIRVIETGLAKDQDAAIGADLLLCANVLCDLRGQGWHLRVDRDGIMVLPPVRKANVNEDKATIRATHLVERDAQLSQPATRRFIRAMERRRTYRGQWHSIFSLMRDGRELAAKLEHAAAAPSHADRLKRLAAAIDPYVQVVTPGAICRNTGLKLGDVWRYFRHTWSTTYQSTPGRRIFFLVRDRAALNHPVVGIGALGSAIVQLHVRDERIGWTGSKFIQQLRAQPTVTWARWLVRWLGALIQEIYINDFLDEGVVSSDTIARPNKATIERLVKLSVDERKAHRLYPARKQHKRPSGPSAVAKWRTQAETRLFRSKRAATLAGLLDARRRLLDAGFAKPRARDLQVALEDPKAVRAIQTVLRHVKAAHVGVNMMDITVCGAIAPYNQLLGGKLVSVLMASPEVTRAYRARYRLASSVIASSMAGRDMRRPANLVLLGTTSLYNVGASQYNRLRIPAQALGGRAGSNLAYVLLGQTAGYGSYHFSRDTMEAIERILRQAQRGRAINSIFGEGVNPKLRKVRSALDVVELPSDLLLQHGSPRLVYAVPLARNFREVLMGRALRPRPIVPQSHRTTKRIVDFWRERWLAGRIESPTVLEAVTAQSLAYPVRHAARVTLPDIAEEVGPLFAVWSPPAVTEYVRTPAGNQEANPDTEEGSLPGLRNEPSYR